MKCSRSSYTLIDSSSLRMKGARVIQVLRFVYLSKVMLNILIWIGKKIKPHVNGNEYADACRFNPRSQIYSSNICQLIRWSHYYLGEKKQSPWDKFCFRLSLQIHHYGTALFWGLYNWIWWTRMYSGEKLKPVSVSEVKIAFIIARKEIM